MKTLRKIMIAIFALNMAHSLFAGDKPLWVIDIKPPGTNGDQFSYLQELNKPGSSAKVYFTQDNDILITFFRCEIPDNRKIKNAKDLTPVAFVALLLKEETRNLIKRVEWSVDESIASTEIYIHVLPEGGYLLRMGDSLQALDSSLNIIHSKTLNPLPKKHKYNIVIPSSGYFFMVERWGEEKNFEVIDWRTFETVEKMSASDISIKGIWNDRLLAIALSKRKYAWLLEKKIGDSSWTSFGHDLIKLQDAKFIYNGAIVITCSMDDSGLFGPSFWFVMKDGKRTDPVIYGKNNLERMGGILPSKRSPVIAVVVYKISRIREFFDIDIAGTNWVDYWDVTTQQRLLRTTSGNNIVGGAWSQDGRKHAVLKKKKLEMYDLPTTPAKEE